MNVKVEDLWLKLQVSEIKGMQRMRRLGFINGFRALAAFWVVSAHCMIWTGWYGIPLPDAKLAVDLFMIISGYLMMVHAEDREGIEPMEAPSTWLRFYARRYFRIAPAYYVSLALAALISGAFLGGYAVLRSQNHAWDADQVYDPSFVNYTTKNLALHASFIFGLLPDYAFSTFLPDWSLGLEMQFYFAFPFIVLAMRRFGVLHTAVALCAICLPFAAIANSFHGMRGGKGLFVEPSFLPLKIQFFLIGMLIARLSRTDIKYAERAVTWTTCLVLVTTQTGTYGRETLVLFGLVLLWLHITSSEHSVMRRLVDAISRMRLVSYMSRASYSVYLFHGFFIALAGTFVFTIPAVAAMSGPSRAALMFIIVVPGAYALAWPIERYIENPGIALGGLILRRSKHRRDAVPEGNLIQGQMAE